MFRYGVTAVLLLALVAGCSQQSERDLAAARAENEALRAEIDKHKADAAAARAELAKVRTEADEKLCRETAEFYMTALSQSDHATARSVCNNFIFRNALIFCWSSREGIGTSSSCICVLVIFFIVPLAPPARSFQ